MVGMGETGGMKERKGENMRSLLFSPPCHSDKTFAFLEEMCLLPPLGARTRRFFLWFFYYYYYFPPYYSVILQMEGNVQTEKVLIGLNQHQNQKRPKKNRKKSSSLSPNPCLALSEGRSTALILTRDCLLLNSKLSLHCKINLWAHYINPY